MEQPKKIMVPVDLSERSARGLEYGAMLADLFGADLLVTTNVNGPELDVLTEFGSVEHLPTVEAAEVAVRAMLKQHTPHVSAKVSVDIRFEDSAADGILAAAKALGAEVIVLASHGRTGMSRWRLGSVAEKIVRGADVPVTVIPVRDL